MVGRKLTARVVPVNDRWRLGNKLSERNDRTIAKMEIAFEGVNNGNSL